MRTTTSTRTIVEPTEEVVTRAARMLRDANLDEHMRAEANLLDSIAGLLSAARQNPDHDPLGLLPVRARRLAEIVLGESADAPRA